jgi:hypothetical protein
MLNEHIARSSCGARCRDLAELNRWRIEEFRPVPVAQMSETNHFVNAGVPANKNTSG